MYIIFGSSSMCDIYPGRGAHDIIGVYENIDDAMSYVLSKKTRFLDWCHIYDTDCKKIIWHKGDNEDDDE